SLEVYDDYTNRIMEIKLGKLLEENSKDIFGENVRIKPMFNSIYDKYEFLDMEPIEFFQKHTLGCGMGVFIKSDGNINKSEEAIKVETFMNKLITMGLNGSFVSVWYCDENVYSNIDNKFYEVRLRNNFVKFYEESGNSYNSTYAEIKNNKLKESVNEIEENFKK
ncbi:hypothetical protein, partial [Clostridium gasigenes]